MTPQTHETHDPVARLADATMQGFAMFAARATPDSPFGIARQTLGDRYADVACEALRAGLRRVLVERREETLAALNAAGNLAAQDVLMGIVNDAIQAVIEEGT
jgi:hypothetical protein